MNWNEVRAVFWSLCDCGDQPRVCRISAPVLTGVSETARESTINYISRVSHGSTWRPWPTLFQMRWSRDMSGVRRIGRFLVSDLVCDLRASCLVCACQSAVFVLRSNLLYGSSMTDFMKQSILTICLSLGWSWYSSPLMWTLITTAWNWDPSCVRPSRPVYVLCTRMCLGALNDHFPSGVSAKDLHLFCISFVLHVPSITSPFFCLH
jgi:hypothetical protein